MAEKDTDFNGSGEGEDKEDEDQTHKRFRAWSIPSSFNMAASPKKNTNFLDIT